MSIQENQVEAAWPFMTQPNMPSLLPQLLVKAVTAHPDSEGGDIYPPHLSMGGA